MREYEWGMHNMHRMGILLVTLMMTCAILDCLSVVFETEKGHFRATNFSY